MTTNILVTGGLGYVGGRVVEVLSKAGYNVYCGTRRVNSMAPAGAPDIHMVYLDWDSELCLLQACENMDCVIHLAGMDQRASEQDPVGSLLVNGVGSIRLLEAAKRAGTKRFIYFSTVHVYGTPLQGLIRETTLPLPLNPYSISHKVTEDFVYAAHHMHQIEGVIVRLSNSFGVPATHDVNCWSLLVNDLCRQAVVNGQLELKSSGKQCRDFIALSDVARAVKHLVQLDAAQLDNGLFNLGGNITLSILEMTNRVAACWNKLTGKKISIIRPECNGNQSTRLDYSCEKLASTGFAINSDVDREIMATLRYCQKQFNT